jgi:hypothetical protein
LSELRVLGKGGRELLALDLQAHLQLDGPHRQGAKLGLDRGSDDLSQVRWS